MEDEREEQSSTALVETGPQLRSEPERALRFLGTVTILFSDIEGFTAYTERFGDEAAQRLSRRHLEIVREQLARHHGIEVKTLGDGVLAAFASARQAVLCAVAVQRAVAEWSAEHPDEAFRVRIGIDTGEPVVHPKEKDFIGRTVNRAARIASQAQGGQILVSEVVRGLVGGIVGVRLVDRGMHKLKGVSERLRLYEAVEELKALSERPRLRLTHLPRWVGEVQVLVRLHALRLLWAGLRLLLRRQNWVIWLPFLLAFFSYQAMQYATSGPTVRVEVREVPGPETEADSALKQEESAEVEFSPFRFDIDPWESLQLLILLVAGPLIAGMTVRMVINAVEGQRLLPWSELWALILARFGTILKATLLYMGAIVVGSFALSLPGFWVLERLGASLTVKIVVVFLLLLPGIYVLARLSLYMAAILLDGRRARESLVWSWRATSGNVEALFWVILVPNLLFVLAFTPLLNFFQLLVQGHPPERAAAWVLEGPWRAWSYDPTLFLINPWALAGLTLAYLQLREGGMKWVVPQFRGQKRWPEPGAGEAGTGL